MSDVQFKIAGGAWLIALAVLIVAVIAAITYAPPEVLWIILGALAVMVALGVAMICAVVRNESTPDPFAGDLLHVDRTWSIEKDGRPAHSDTG